MAKPFLTDELWELIEPCLPLGRRAYFVVAASVRPPPRPLRTPHRHPRSVHDTGLCHHLLENPTKFVLLDGLRVKTTIPQFETVGIGTSLVTVKAQSAVRASSGSSTPMEITRNPNGLSRGMSNVLAVAPNSSVIPVPTRSDPNSTCVVSLGNRPSATTSPQVTLQGTARGAITAGITGGLATVSAPVVDCAFTLLVDIHLNAVNDVFVTGIFGDGTRSAPTPVTVTHDGQPHRSLRSTATCSAIRLGGG